MRRTIILSVFLSAAAIAAVANADSLCERAAWLMFNRHLDTTYLRQSYDLLAQCRQLAPTHEKTLYLWSRMYVRLGDDATTKADHFRLYNRALAIAETLRAVNDSNPDGHMWWAVAYGRIGQTRGVMNSLFMVPALKREFSRVLALDPRYPTAYDAFGVLYYELPGIAGGDLAKSEQYLVQGLNIDPNYTVMRLDLAKVYARQKRWTDAREQLGYVLSTTFPTYPADFELSDRPEAEQLLKDIAGK
jgi:tetratricopeptide (TPR) repeat protein